MELKRFVLTVILSALAVLLAVNSYCAGSVRELEWYGFYHMQTYWGGYHMTELAPGINFAAIDPYLVQPDWIGERGVIGANNLGLKVMLEFSPIYINGRTTSEAVWRPQLKALADQLNAVGKNNPDCIAGIELSDEPYGEPADAGPMQRFLDVAREYFPTIPMFYNYGPWALDPAHVAYDPILPKGMSYFCFDSYWFNNPNMPEAEFRAKVRQDLTRAKFAGKGLPILYITTGAQFQDNYMPSPKHIEWLMDEVEKDPLVAGVWWFLYSDAPDQNFRGARRFPDSLKKIMDFGAAVPKCYQPKIDFGFNNDEQGISLLQPDGGKTTAETIGGIACRGPASAQDRYFSFNIVDTFINKANEAKVFLRVDYYDSDGSITPQYDGTGGEYTDAKILKLKGSNTWKTQVWELSDCYFGNRQTGGADFRLQVNNDHVYVDKVTISMIPFVPRDVTPPTTPSDLAVTALTSSEMSLKWKVSRDDSSMVCYKVLRDGKHIATMSTNSFDDAGLAPETVYHYAVIAYDMSGNESPPSMGIQVSTMPVDKEAPSVPSHVKAQAKTYRSVQVSWRPSHDNRAVAGYKIYRDGTPIGKTSDTSYWDNGLQPQSQHTYTISAYDAAGNESARSVQTSRITTFAQSAFQISNVRTKGVSYACEAVSGLKLGDLFYTDRTYTFSAIPSPYIGLPYIRIANNFNNELSGGPSISFDINASAYIYIIWSGDARMQDWVTSAYTLMPGKMEGSWGRTFSIYRSKKAHATGTVTTYFTRSVPTMYSIVVEPVGEPR